MFCWSFRKGRSAFGILIDELRLIVQFAVDLDDDATRRSIDVACRLDRLDDRNGTALFDFLARGWKFDEGHVAELFLGVICNADSPDVPVNADVFVILCVFNERHDV